MPFLPFFSVAEKERHGRSPMRQSDASPFRVQRPDSPHDEKVDAEVEPEGLVHERDGRHGEGGADGEQAEGNVPDRGMFRMDDDTAYRSQAGDIGERKKNSQMAKQGWNTR